MTTSAPPGNRFERRRAETRAALVRAARQLLAETGETGASIQVIAERADVGFGSFYNHFASKQELFEAAVEEVLEEHGAMLDELTADLADPAEVFAAALRITARFPRTHPELAEIFARTGLRYLTAPSGLAPRALRDLERARDAGRLSFRDPTVALACTGGALLGVLHVALETRAPSAVDRLADELTLNLLRMFGLSAEDAGEVVGRPLPTSA